jgi:chemotaxis protein CheX
MSLQSSRAMHAPVPFDPQWKHVLEAAVVEVFQMMVGAQLAPRENPEGQPSGQQTAMVGMAGALTGMTTIRCTTPTAGKFAALMLGGDDPSMIGDAMGELCNMVAGNFKSKVASLADQCVLSVPTVISGDDYAMHNSEPTEAVSLAFEYEGGLVWVVLTIHQ